MARVRELTSGRPLPLILTFALPLLLGNMLQQLYSVVDAVIVGRFLGIEALAAVGASSSVIFLVLGFCNGCGCGFAIPVAQSFGARDYGRMRSQIRHGFILASVIGFTLAVAASWLTASILHWMATPEDIFHDAWIYLLITFIGIPLTFFYGLLAAVIRALGDSRTPFLFLVLSTTLNIILDFVTVVFLGLGVLGVGLSTLTAQGVSAFLCWWYMKKNYPILRYESDSEKKINGFMVRHLLWVGIPMGLQFSITAIGSMVMQGANNALGTACVAAYTTAIRIKMVFLTVLESTGIAMATYQGQNLGARKISRLGSGILSALLLGLIYCVAAFLVLFFGARLLSSAFMDGSQTEVLDLSTHFLRVNISFFPFLGLLVIHRYSIQGLGHTNLAMLSGVMEMIARILVSVLLVPYFAFEAICYCDPAAWITACLFVIPAFWLIYRRLKRKYPETPSSSLC